MEIAKASVSRFERVIPNPKARLLDQVREVMRVKHYSLRTEEAYVAWIKRFIFFHQKRHPRDLGALEISAFLSDLAVRLNLSASTQNQAFNALLFLYREVLNLELGDVSGTVRAKASRRLPVVLTRPEVARLLAALDGTYRLMGRFCVSLCLELNLSGWVNPFHAAAGVEPAARNEILCQ